MTLLLRQTGITARFSLIVLLVMLTAVDSAWPAVSSEQNKATRIVAVSHCDYPPVSFWDRQTNKPSGFFVDIMENIAGRAGLQVAYTCRNTWPEIISAIENNEANLGILLRSDEREKILLFSTPLDTTYLSYFARAQSRIDADQVPAGYTVGVIKGSMSYEQLRSKPGLKLQTVDSYQTGIFSLLAGEIGLFAGEESMILKRARETRLDDRIRKVGKPFIERERGLAVRKDNVQLLEQLNRSLSGFVGSPAYQEIYLKWYGTPTPYWTGKRILTASGIFLFFVVCGMAFWRYRSLSRINKDLILQMAERKQAEEKSRMTDQKYSSLIETTNTGYVIIDEQGRVIDANQEYVNLTGRERLEEVIGHNVLEWTAPYDQARNAEEVRKCAALGMVRNLEIDYLSPAGKTTPIELNATVLRTAGEFYILTLCRDITERKRAEEALKKSEAFVKNILETVDEGFIIIDREYRILSANNAYTKQVRMPHDAVLGRHCYEVSHKLDKPCFEAGEDCAVRRVFQSNAPDYSVHTHRDEKGVTVFVEIKAYPIRDESGNVLSVIEIVNDITEKKKLEGQLRHAQKMEAVGQLAGGIAHDFNNILTAIMGYGSLMKARMRDEDPMKYNLQQMLDAAERAANLTRGLLAFSRKQVITPRLVNLNEIVRNVEKLLQRVIGEDVELRVVLADQNMIIMADSSQLEQILMNLATNARDAMPEGGALTIRTEFVELTNEFIRMHGYGQHGRYALISVADTGLGIDGETKLKIFEPFFTTKEVGKGTGLGLSIVYGIVKQHNGYIICSSEPGKGSTFRIYLPIAKGEYAKTDAADLLPVPGGTETVLVAEDDIVVNTLMRDLLTQHGYTVISAADGEEAIAKFEQNRDRIKVLVLDVIMPKKSGKEVFTEIKKIQPDMKAIFTSGYTADIIHQRHLLEAGINFLTKPITPNELLHKLRKVLDDE